MKKKILIFSLMYIPRVGGAEVAIKEITDRISQDKYEFHMITVGGNTKLPSVEQVGNILVHRISLFKQEAPKTSDFFTYPMAFNKWYFQFVAYFKARKLHKKYSYDGVWAVMAQGGGIPAGLFKLTLKKISYILTLQEGLTAHAMKTKMLPLYPLYVQAFKRADALQAISQYLASFGKSMGFKGEPRVIPNGVDYALFTKSISSESVIRLKKEYGIQNGEKILIHTGRFVEKNGIADIIKTLPRLSSHTKLLLVGEGPCESRLRDLAQREGVKSRVIFAGHKSYHDLPEYYTISDIFIRPSLSEGFGNVFVEAMAAGIPVIGTDVGGIKDFLKEGKTGWVCSPHDTHCIANKVHYILNPHNKERVEKVLLNAKKMVQDRYDWDTIAHDMETLFNETLYVG